MAEAASIEGKEIALHELERIIKYQFNDYSLLFCTLWALDTDHLEPQPEIPRPQLLVRMGRLALDVVGWGQFCTKALGKGQHRAETFSHDNLAKFIELRGDWDEEANLERVAEESGLLPYLERGEGFIGPRLQAIIGAVLIDAEGRLDQVKNVLRVLGIVDENGLCSIPVSNADSSTTETETETETETD